MIEAKNLWKRFDEGDVLKDVSFTVKKGSIYGLLGTNGAGKTTLLKTIAGVYQPERGQVTISSQPVFENPAIQERFVFMPDALYFFSQYTIQQMAQFYKQIYPTWSDERFHALHEVFRLDPRKKIHKLSKGTKRQVAFWLLLSTMADVFILDEPFDGLDPVMRKKIKSLLLHDVAEREVTILISSHNLREIEDFCDHIGMLHAGQLVLDRELDDVKSEIHKVQAAFKDGLPEDLFRSVDLLYKEERGSVLLCIVRGDVEDILIEFRKWQPVILDVLPLTLEEIFIYEMGEVGYAIETIPLS
ncbi:ABC transporter ATP-binding protein [Tuberibacillus calidus]|uniref:ABC transporter ATP-binding protein n=1 Tax=Tuberibacillus calidus TaxID=340097 RepID=UPI0004044208|nr:ABC transporter ATP-binding protein [Tuberibacillus calidus]